MRNLTVCLREYSSVLLEALARLWLVEEPALDKSELAEQLASAMVAPGAAAPILDMLDTAAREALAYVITRGGAVRGYLVSRRYGRIRPLGPNPLRRIQPWIKPDNPLESLYYRGLVYRAYDTLDDYRGEILFVPPQLAAVLPPMEYEHPSFAVDVIPSPASQQRDGESLAADVFTILVHLRRTKIRWTKGPFFRPQHIAALGPRLRGQATPERMQMIQHLARRSGLVGRERGLVRPGSPAREWLRSEPHERSELLFRTWRNDVSGHELSFVNGLRWESMGRPYDAPAVREAILSHLKLCPPGEWISVSSFVSALKDTAPDFLRPDGDYDSWYIRDTQTKRFLTGFESWDQVEGQLAAHIVTRPLCWLGAVALGPVEGPTQRSAFKMLPMGRAFLGLQEPESRPERVRTCVVDEDFGVQVPSDSSLYDRYQLERFSEWQRDEDDMIVYRLTRESVWRGRSQGIEAPQMLAFLRRLTGDAIPARVAPALHEWGKRYGSISLRRTSLLQAADESTMRDLWRDPKMASLLGEPVSSRGALVEDGDLDLVIKQLKKMGHWPRVERNDEEPGSKGG